MSFTPLADKDPDATSMYQFDWSPFFSEIGDTLSSAQIDVMDPTSTTVDGASDLTIVAHTQTAAGVVTFWVAGGTPGVSYTVRCRVTGVNTSPVQCREERTTVIPVKQT